VSVLLGDGDGTFQPQVTYQAGSSPRALVAVANSASNDVSVLLGAGDGTFRPPVTYQAGTGPISIVAVDLNNDGRLDLYLTNGYVSADKRSNYWYDYGLIAGGNKLIIADAKNWPGMRGRSLSGYQKKHLWVNMGGSFIDQAVGLGVTDVYDGRAVALADLFGRGVLDVLVANQNGPLLMYRNTVAEGRDWVQFDLEGMKGRGGKSNRSAIGALVRVFWTMKGADRTQEQVQVVSGGNGYASQNMRRLHFGLGEGAKIDRVVIEWPGGEKQTLKDLAVNKVHPIQEGGR